MTPAECTAAGQLRAPRGNAAYRELDLTVDRRFAEGGPRVTTYNFNTFQGSIGLRGPLISNLKWDINGAYGESSRVQSSTSGTWPRRNRLCARTTSRPASIRTGGCVPLNIFGPNGSITPEMLAVCNTTVYNFVDTR